MMTFCSRIAVYPKKGYPYVKLCDARWKINIWQLCCTTCIWRLHWKIYPYLRLTAILEQKWSALVLPFYVCMVFLAFSYSLCAIFFHFICSVQFSFNFLAPLYLYVSYFFARLYFVCYFLLDLGISLPLYLCASLRFVVVDFKHYYFPLPKSVKVISTDLWLELYFFHLFSSHWLHLPFFSVSMFSFHYLSFYIILQYRHSSIAYMQSVLFFHVSFLLLLLSISTRTFSRFRHCTLCYSWFPVLYIRINLNGYIYPTQKALCVLLFDRLPSSKFTNRNKWIKLKGLL